MSSEKRWMSSKPLDKEVPPLSWKTTSPAAANTAGCVGDSSPFLRGRALCRAPSRLGESDPENSGGRAGNLRLYQRVLAFLPQACGPAQARRNRRVRAEA